MNDAPHPALLPAGLYDLLPPEAEIEADVGARLMSVLAAHGYERVKPPLAEFEETLLSEAGAAMASDTFRMMDPISHRMIGLLARLVAAAGTGHATRSALDRLDLPERARQERDRLAAVLDGLAAAMPGLKVTVDPVENRGFEYHTGISFTFFARVGPELGPLGELGRGGRYEAGPPEAPEPATGVTLYTDTILRTLPAPPPRRRVLVPVGADLDR